MKRRTVKRGIKSSGRSISYGSIQKIVTQGAMIGVAGWAVLALSDKLAKVFNISTTNKVLVRSVGILGTLFLLPKFVPRHKHIIEQAAIGGVILLGVSFLDKITGTGLLSGEDASDDEVIARQLAHQLDVAGYLPEELDGYSMSEAGLLGASGDHEAFSGMMEGMIEGEESDGQW